MEFEKQLKKEGANTAAMLGGGVGGAMVSRGVFGVIHTETAVTGTDYKKIAKRAGIILVSGLGAVMIPATDPLTAAGKGAALGMAIMQGIDLVADLSAKSPTTAKLAQGTTKKDKFLAKALGLSCPGDVVSYPALGRPRRYKKALRMPNIPTMEFQPALAAAEEGIFLS